MNTIREYDIGPQDGVLLRAIHDHFEWRCPISEETILVLVDMKWSGRLILTVDEENRAVAMGLGTKPPSIGQILQDTA